MDTDSDKQVLFYERKFYMFSNFSSFMVEYNGVVWMTSEHAYQAAKFTDPTLCEQIRLARSADDAFKFARAHNDAIRADWQQIKVRVMEEVVRAKLEQHPYIQKKLLETGNKEIIENSPVDSFWGWGPERNGENHLGKIWMKLREELLGK